MIGAVVIGRNEGERLRRCLASVRRETPYIVYVDSGSSDESVAFARSAGIHVVELDSSLPFSAARARNAGAAALLERNTQIEAIQFIDGDCEIVTGWMATAAQALDSDPCLGIVTGWRREIHPEASIYNALCEVEWHRPAGDISSCGGDIMVRRLGYDAVKGFNPAVIAAEDDEFCVRIRRAGYGIRRLPVTMTLHDAAITSFRQWWRRAVRAGHGFGQVSAMHRGVFALEKRRVLFWGAVLPICTLVGLSATPWMIVIAATLYGASFVKTAIGLRQQVPLHLLPQLAGLLTLSKFPNLVGMAIYNWRANVTHTFRLIEYK